jgi:hypothetical protein
LSRIPLHWISYIPGGSKVIYLVHLIIVQIPGRGGVQDPPLHSRMLLCTVTNFPCF